MIASNLLWAEWISFSASVSLFGILTLYYSSFVPEALQRIFRYGKTAETKVLENKIKKLHKIEIPKKWFYHFYVFACTFYCLLSWSVFRVYILRTKVPQIIEVLLDSFVGQHRRASVNPESVILAVILIQFQVSRRLYECTQLSIFSADGKMNLIHYLTGFSFYFGVGLSLLAEAPEFAPTRGLTEIVVNLGDFFSANHFIGIIVFGISSYIQFRSHVILARLRKDSKGRVVHYEHSIPRGFGFEWVSCPHYFAEILIYLALSLVLNGRSMTWWMVCSFVVTNQVIVGLFNHQWYLDHFKDYPKARKAVIPFLI